MKVLILGAGSIGNHMAFGCSLLGWCVSMYDPDPEALMRTRTSIYPKRYGAWNEEIELLTVKPGDYSSYDLLIIGTPPEYHTQIALEALERGSRNILVEKPLSMPKDGRLAELQRVVSQKSANLFVGYNHTVSPSYKAFVGLVKALRTRDVKLQIECRWQEDWEGIFKAHPWLDGPSDSYLGFTERGGGAACEHSHGLHMLLHTATVLERSLHLVKVDVHVCDTDKSSYDDSLELVFSDDHQSEYIYISDVNTWPPKKSISVSLDNNDRVSWHIDTEKSKDIVEFMIGGESGSFSYDKNRRLDFVYELVSIADAIGKHSQESSLCLEHALNVQSVLSKVFG